MSRAFLAARRRAAACAAATTRVLDDAALQRWTLEVLAAQHRRELAAGGGRAARLPLVGPRLVAPYRRAAAQAGPARAVRILARRAAGRAARGVLRRAARPRDRRIPLFVDALPLSVPRPSGVGETVRGLVQALAADPAVTRRYRIELLTGRDGRTELAAHLPDLPGVRLRALPLPARVLLALPRLPWLPPVDLLLGRGVYLFGNFTALPLRRSRSVLVVHDLGFVHLPTAVPPVFGALLRHKLPRWCAEAGRVAAVSQATADDLTATLGVDPRRILLLRNGVDPRRFSPRPAAEIDEARRRHGLPQRYLLHLGNLEPRKNLVALIQAYRALPGPLRTATALLLVGGSGWAGAGIDDAIAGAQAAGDRVVRPAGYLPDADLPALISGAAAVVQVSLLEGFGFAPLQAMACGTPVVVADNSALPEVVGPAGIFVDATRVESITAGLETVLTEDPAAAADRIALGRTRAAQFSWAAGARPLTDWLAGLPDPRGAAR